MASCPQPDVVYYLDIPAAGGRPGFQVVAANCHSDSIEMTGRPMFVLWDPGDRLSALIAALTRFAR